jgi:hypothetical protein
MPTSAPWQEDALAAEVQRPRGPWDADKIVRPSAGENLQALGRGAIGGAYEGAGAAAGMAAGAAMGAPAGPVGVAAGAALGGTAGMIAGRGMRRATVGEVADMPPAVRPFGVAGETFGAGVPFAAAPVALGRMAGRLPQSTVGTFVNRVLDTAAQRPFAFLGAEMSMLASAATAGGISEAYAPGQALPRIGAEVVGGMFNPARMGTMLAQYAAHKVRGAIQSFARPAQETQAAKLVSEILKEAGEDPALLVPLLRSSGIPGADLTAAQKTGSLALGAIEERLAQQSARFGVEARQKLQEGLQATEGMITALRGTGDPQALRQAAEMRQRQFQVQLTSLVRTAEADAIRAARGIAQDPQSARAMISRQAREALDTVMTESRAAERELWSRIPRETQASSSSLLEAYDAIRADLLPEEALPGVLEAFVARMRQQQASTDVGELLRFRSRALEWARDAASGPTPNRNEARIYGLMAEAALDDLSSVNVPGMSPAVIDDARAFSRALNESFGGTFAGQAMGRTGAGAERLPPELLMRRALATGSEAADLRFDELDQATRFLARQGMDSPQSAQAIELMQDAQERMLRLTAAEAIDPQTGRASATRLSSILQRNEALFNRFPEVRAAAERAIAGEQGLADMTRLSTQASRAADQRAAFAQIAKYENPVDAVGRAITGRAPVRDLRAMAKVAQRGGPEAVEGLKASVFDHIMRQGGEEMDPAAIRRALFDPQRPGQPSLADVMQRSGILAADDVERMTTILDAADRLVSTRSVRPDLADLAGETDGLQDLLLRIQGARLGTALSAGGPMQGSGLIAAAAGSRYLRNLFNKLDVETTSSILIEAAKDPELMAMLIEKGTSPSAQFRIGQQIHAYLLAAGYRFSADVVEGVGVSEAEAGEMPQEAPEIDEEASSLINEFATTHPELALVAPEMADMLESGQAQTLEEAYRMAIRAQ